MKRTHLIILYCVILALIFAVIYYRETRHLVGPNKISPQADIADFAACARAGYPIQESYPERCTTPDGRTFVRSVPPPDELSPQSEDLSDLIRVDSPLSDGVISSPLTISGEARGNWFFEASFPARLEDANGEVILQAPIMAQGEWMTEDFVPFSASLSFAKPATPTGRLILEKDNPSGLAKNARQLIIPIRFE